MADLSQNLIPTLRAAGRFEALAPFDKVVNIATYYSVEALRTIEEMEALKLNLYSLVFEPIGVKQEDYSAVLERARAAGSIIVTLTARNTAPVYVLSTYFKSFPLVDGVAYERMVLVADLGACPPALKDALEQVKTHMVQYIADTVGIDSTVQLGTVPTIGYVSASEAQIFENTRLNKIKAGENDVAKIKALEAQAVADHAYIAELEARLGVTHPVTT